MQHILRVCIKGWTDVPYIFISLGPIRIETDSQNYPQLPRQPAFFSCNGRGGGGEYQDSENDIETLMVTYIGDYISRNAIQTYLIGKKEALSCIVGPPSLNHERSCQGTSNLIGCPSPASDRKRWIGLVPRSEKATSMKTWWLDSCISTCVAFILFPVRALNLLSLWVTSPVIYGAKNGGSFDFEICPGTGCQELLDLSF